MAPRAATREQLAGAAKAALGGGRRLAAVERVVGGSKKGVYRPAIRLVDRDGTHCPADLAIVEDLQGENLEELLARDPHATEPVMARLGEALASMGRHRAPAYGKVAIAEHNPNAGLELVHA